MLYQVLPSIAKFDAISQHTMRIDAELKKRNITTQIVAEHIGSDFTELAIKPSDVVSFDNLPSRQAGKKGEYIFYDCAAESPKGRRSFCYDRKALDSRKEHKPKNNVVDAATVMGIELLTEEQYRELQQLGEFDTKTSSWVKTPDEIRKLGGAIFCDRRFNHVFTYHNGAESYYGGRAFRGSLRV